MSGPSSPASAGSDPTPRQLGYRMPPEWHPHQATWLAWPTDARTWPDRLPEVERIYVQMIAHLVDGEKVCILVDDPATEQRVQQVLARAQIAVSQVRFFLVSTADAWIRDYGPNFLIRNRGDQPLAFNDWGFNAWGNKYPELLADDGVPVRLAQHLGIPRFTPGLILEGGSIDVNGRGSLLTTEQCLLNPNRNSGLTKNEIERKLHDFLAIDQVIWLGDGIVGDDTDGHIDDVARFVDNDTIICCREQDSRDENFQALEENWKRLRSAASPSGSPFRVVALPMPGPVGEENRLPASYANFYVGNQVVLLPTFGHPHDRAARETLQGLFPDRKVVGIGCEPLVWGLGAIHCVTQQQPAVIFD